MPKNVFATVEKASSLSEIAAEMQFKLGKAKIQKFLSAQEEIRVYVPNSGNFGHQASTINILYRLIELGGTTFRVVFAGGKLTWEKLAALIYGLGNDYVPSKVINGAMVYFTEMKDIGDFPQAMFGVTGGLDNNEKKNILAPYVKWFLCLQPYGWTGITGRIVSTNTIYYLEKMGFPPDVIEFEFKPEDKIPDRVYYCPDPELTPEIVEDYITKERRKGECVKKMLTLYGDGASIAPIYYSLERPAAKTPDIFFNLITGIINYVRSGGNGPVIVVMFGEKQTDAQYEALQTLLGGDALSPSGGAIPPLELPYRKKYFAKGDRKSYYDKVTVLFGDENVTAEKIGEAIAGDDPQKIVVVALGGVPKIIFDYFFWISALAGTFEGMGTASLMLNFGWCFFHLRSSSSTTNLYIQPPPGTVDADFSSRGMGASNDLGMTCAQFDAVVKAAEGKDPPVYAVSDFLTESLAADSKLNLKFRLQGYMYHSEAEDKLMVALRYIVYKMTEYIPPTTDELNKPAQNNKSTAEQQTNKFRKNKKRKS